MKIDQIIDSLEGVLSMQTEELPIVKALGILTEYFYQYKIPIKHIGKIKIDVDDTFFNDPDKANAALRNFALFIMRIHNIAVAEYGEDTEFIFGDMLSGMGITCRNDNGNE